MRRVQAKQRSLARGETLLQHHTVGLVYEEAQQWRRVVYSQAKLLCSLDPRFRLLTAFGGLPSHVLLCSKYRKSMSEVTDPMGQASWATSSGFDL